MSGVNITILEGGKAENFGQVTKLRTSNGTDHDLWVPKGDVETKHLSVKKNGLHYTNQYEPTASEKKNGKFHDVYGWDTITVSVKQKAKGKKRKTNPSTGLEYDAPTSVDVDDNGNLVETELPVSIEIEVPPSQLQYYDGQTVSKSGMVVKAYYADGEEWGTVPLSDIVLDPQTASGSGSSSGSKELDGLTVHYAHAVSWSYTAADIHTVFAWSEEYLVATTVNGHHTLHAYSKNSGIAQRAHYIHDNDGTKDFINERSGTYTYNGHTETYYHAYCGNSYNAGTGTLTPTASSNNDTIAKILFEVPDEQYETQEITVKWTPPEGDEELTDTFYITVIPSN